MTSKLAACQAPPIEIRLGHLEPGSVAPAVFGLVERGVLKRPALARQVACQVELRMSPHPPVRMSFGRDVILVEDAAALEPEPPDPGGEEHLLAEVDLEQEDAEAPAFETDLDTRERALQFAPELVVSGSLPDVVAIMATPLMGGLPSLRDRRGLSALRSIAAGRVRFRGSPRLVRRLLRLLQI